MRHPLLVCTIVLSVATPAFAELKPDEVAIIAMDQSLDSRRLADHYAEARGIPKTHVYRMLGKPGRSIGRETWEKEVRPDLRKWLTDNALEDKIRCMVTCWDVPLRVGAVRKDSEELRQRKQFLDTAREKLVEEVAKLIDRLDRVAREDAPEESKAIAADAPAKELAEQLEAAAKGAEARLREMAGGESVKDEERKKAAGEFERLFLAAGGLQSWIRTIQAQGEAVSNKPEVAERLEKAKQALAEIAQKVGALASERGGNARDLRLLQLMAQASGPISAIQWIDAQRKSLEQNQTSASFDSELSLLHRPEYPLNRWQPNLLYYRFDRVKEKPYRTLMVSRLAAPSLQQAMQLVDTAIATEKSGLTGKVYLDARGLNYDPKSGQRGSYGQYDQSIRDLAERLKENTDLEVVLDNKGKLFQPGTCPDAALYCGWYSLGRYVDAFDWVPGSVGYHIASSEATTLREPKSTVWCNAMLRDGICATLGPTFEPYLAAFPLPDDFFPLLLTGKHTLVEVYYRTKPFNSWAMVLVGDPLYNPFKNHPRLAEDDLPERLKTQPAAAPE